MKTPEEIKKGLECCNTLYGCKQCPYDAGDEDLHCCVKRNADVLALINQLQEDKKQLERERDAAVKYGLVRTEAKIAIPAVITNPYYCHRCDMQFAVLNDKPEAVMHCPFCGARRGEPPKTEP